jgi:DNA-binding response OmpR family regulator
MLAACFSRFDFSVRTFADGETALQALAGPAASVAARVILLDYDLPGSDGLAVLRQLRSAGTLERSRVIMLSLTVARDAVARAINTGVHGYIAKPFQWKTVLERVHACLDQPVPLFVIGPSARPSVVAH